MTQNKANTKILLITTGNADHSSSRIRGLQYITYLESAGFSVKWLPRIPRKAKNSFLNKILFAIGKRINLFRIYTTIVMGSYKFLFIQKFLLPKWLLLFCQRKKKKIIFDFDDAIYISPLINHSKEKTIRMIEAADLVISSCPVLNDYSRKFSENSVIITSAVDSDVIIPGENTNKMVTIGWIGSEWTSKYLSILEHVFDELSKKYKLRLLLIGSKDFYNFKIETELVTWTLKDEASLLKNIDIGIMPLFDDEFANAKGGFKLIQYMAAGKPIIASPVGINRDLVQNGENGFLCADDKAWITCFCYLIENEAERKRMGERGREIVLDKYSLDVCSKKLIKNINAI